MKFTELSLSGAFLIEPELLMDERGFFARAWCVHEFREAGLPLSLVQASISFTRIKGTVRGMHYQTQPSLEAKLVRCVRGAVLDVIVDIRPDSATFLRYEAIEISADNHRALYIPAGFAHGFQTIENDVELFYEMTDYYQPDLASGFRPDDGLVDVQWPLPVSLIHERDASYPDIRREEFEGFRGLGARPL
jgi:dTDP-4-dehydrorhamnose 3,5-epimerase